MYSNIGKKYPEEWASTILAILALIITCPIYYFYRNGERIRMNSKFAQQVAKDREAQLKRRKESATGANDEEKRVASEGGVREEQNEEAIEESAPSDVDNTVNRDMAEPDAEKRRAM